MRYAFRGASDSVATELARIDFRGGATEACVGEGVRALAGPRRPRRVLDVGYGARGTELKGRPRARPTAEVVPPAGGTQRAAAVAPRALGGWPFSIGEGSVEESVRPEPIRHQAGCARALGRHSSDRPAAGPHRPWAIGPREPSAPHGRAALPNLPPGPPTATTAGG